MFIVYWMLIIILNSQFSTLNSQFLKAFRASVGLPLESNAPLL